MRVLRDGREWSVAQLANAIARFRELDGRVPKELKKALARDIRNLATLGRIQAWYITSDKQRLDVNETKWRPRYSLRCKLHLRFDERGNAIDESRTDRRRKSEVSESKGKPTPATSQPDRLLKQAGYDYDASDATKIELTDTFPLTGQCILSVILEPTKRPVAIRVEGLDPDSVKTQLALVIGRNTDQDNLHSAISKAKLAFDLGLLYLFVPDIQVSRPKKTGSMGNTCIQVTPGEKTARIEDLNSVNGTRYTRSGDLFQESIRRCLGGRVANQVEREANDRTIPRPSPSEPNSANWSQVKGVETINIPVLIQVGSTHILIA
ncbi:MAG TPA: hypothetical protein VJB59_05035 [Bdellovibrionota bacterium]|nr:hypothetical protein [Bdellovibrionota bacterium]